LVEQRTENPRASSSSLPPGKFEGTDPIKKHYKHDAFSRTKSANTSMKKV
jgi:hypothetical protein